MESYFHTCAKCTGKFGDFLKDSSFDLHQHVSVRLVLSGCEEHRHVFIDFFYEFDEMTRGRSDNSSKQYY